MNFLIHFKFTTRLQLLNNSRIVIYKRWLGSDEDGDSKKPNNDALNKLNSLLQQMITENVSLSNKKLDLAKPRSSKLKISQSEIKKDSFDVKIANAAKNIAGSLGGDIKKTESELLSKLLRDSMESTSSERDIPASSLSDIVKGMKVDKGVHSIIPSTTIIDNQYGKKLSKNHGYMTIQKVDLLGEETLGIFDVKQEWEQVDVCSTWNYLHKREMELLVTHPPANYYQQLILWTKQGKIWKFPVDNEQDLNGEENVYFTDHIFLEKHLEPWCPKKGPIRHFMELVCVGLSKNPYLSVESKRDHISWYKEYFKDKKQLLQEVGALPLDSIENLNNV